MFEIGLSELGGVASWFRFADLRFLAHELSLLDSRVWVEKGTCDSCRIPFTDSLESTRVARVHPTNTLEKYDQSDAMIQVPGRHPEGVPQFISSACDIVLLVGVNPHRSYYERFCSREYHTPLVYLGCDTSFVPDYGSLCVTVSEVLEHIQKIAAKQ